MSEPLPALPIADGRGALRVALVALAGVALWHRLGMDERMRDSFAAEAAELRARLREVEVALAGLPAPREPLTPEPVP